MLLSEISPLSKRSELPSLSRRLTYDIPEASGDVLQVAAYLGDKRGNSRVYLITPSDKGESTSSFVYQLALSLVQVEAKPVLIVALNEQSSFKTDHTIDIDQFQPGSKVPVVVASPFKSSAILSSQEYAAFLEKARDHFSFILIDAPSVSKSVPGLLIAPHCNGVILTAIKDKTLRRDAQINVKKLQQIGAQMMGFVLLEEQVP